MKKLFSLALLLLSFCYFQSSWAQTTTSSNSITIRVGIGRFYPPFIYNYSSGFDIALANALCKQLDYHCVFYTKSDEDLLSSLQQDKLDAAFSAMSITAARAQIVNFSEPYIISTVQYVGVNKLQYPIDLTKAKIGVLAGSTFEAYLKTTLPTNSKFKTYNDPGNLLTALRDGDIEVTLLDTPVANYWINQSHGSLKALGPTFSLSFDQGFAIAVNKVNLFLTNQFNQALVQIVANGTYGKLIQTYFNLSNEEFNNAKVNPAGILPPTWMMPYFPQSHVDQNPFDDKVALPPAPVVAKK